MCGRWRLLAHPKARNRTAGIAQLTGEECPAFAKPKSQRQATPKLLAQLACPTRGRTSGVKPSTSALPTFLLLPNRFLRGKIGGFAGSSVPARQRQTVTTTGVRSEPSAFTTF